MLKDLFDDIRLVDEANNAPFESPQGGETCMMDVGPDTEYSGTMVATKAIEQRRHVDERQDVYTRRLPCFCRIGCR